MHVKIVYGACVRVIVCVCICERVCEYSDVLVYACVFV